MEEGIMTDPRDHAQRHDASEHTPDVGRPQETPTEPRNDADDLASDGDDLGPDANELDADIAVEADTIETVDPENPPA
jgi:hypothetical protein